MFMILLINFIV